MLRSSGFKGGTEGFILVAHDQSPLAHHYKADIWNNSTEIIIKPTFATERKRTKEREIEEERKKKGEKKVRKREAEKNEVRNK